MVDHSKKPVEVLDLQTGQTTIYVSLTEAVKQLGLNYDSFKVYAGKQGKNPERTKPFKARYFTRFLANNPDETTAKWVERVKKS